jgi:NitT/TauT family transport system substrate-binding protein
MTTRIRFRAVRPLVALLAIPLVALGAEAPPVPTSAGALRVYGNTATIEIAPVLLAAQKLHGAPVIVSNGGVPNLFRPGEAQLATNAETQALRTSVANPDLRIILTVSEGLYRIVARRSKGINSLADLKGKRIATIPVTSSGYFLHRMLRTVGLDYADVTAVPLIPLSRMVDALEKGEVDAVTIWEPEMENAFQRIGDDAIEFSGHGVYRELFNLNTTAQQLADPVQRRRIVEFVRSVLRATRALHEDPREAWQLVSKSGGLYQVPLIARTWHHHGYPGIIVPDLLDVMEDEEKYVAREGQGRTPRSRAELARLIDDSVLKEALEGHPELRITRPDPEAVREQVLGIP